MSETQEVKYPAQIYQEKLDKALELWKDSPYLEGIPEKYRRQAALIFDVQKKDGSVFGDKTPENAPSSDDMLQLTQKVLTDLHPLAWIGLQPLYTPAGSAHYLRFRYTGQKSSEDIAYDDFIISDKESLPEIVLVIEGADVSSHTETLNVPEITADTLRDPEQISVVAKDIRRQITAEILDDLRRNVGTEDTWECSLKEGETIKEQWERLYIKMVEVSNVVHRETLRCGTNWAVAGKDAAELLGSSIGHSQIGESDEVVYLGEINHRWKLFVDPNSPPNDILMGYSGTMFDNGYIYLPYGFLTPTSAGNGNFRLLHRRSKWLQRSGYKYYVRIKGV